MKKKSEFTSSSRAEYVAPTLECNEIEIEQGIATSSTVEMNGSGINGFTVDNSYNGTPWS